MFLTQSWKQHNEVHLLEISEENLTTPISHQEAVDDQNCRANDMEEGVFPPTFPGEVPSPELTGVLLPEVPCSVRGKSSIENSLNVKTEKNAPPAIPDQEKEETALCHTWAMVKPGNTKEKITFFAAHQCTNRMGATKTVSLWDGDRRPSKRQEKSGDDKETKTQLQKLEEVGSRSFKPEPSVSESRDGVCAGRPLSVLEMVASLEQRFSAAPLASSLKNNAKSPALGRVSGQSRGGSPASETSSGPGTCDKPKERENPLGAEEQSDPAQVHSRVLDIISRLESECHKQESPHKTCSLSRNSGSGKGGQVLPAQGHGKDQERTNNGTLDTLAAQVHPLRPILQDQGPPELDYCTNRMGATKIESVLNVNGQPTKRQEKSGDDKETKTQLQKLEEVGSRSFKPEPSVSESRDGVCAGRPLSVLEMVASLEQRFSAAPLASSLKNNAKSPALGRVSGQSRGGSPASETSSGPGTCDKPKERENPLDAEEQSDPAQVHSRVLDIISRLESECHKQESPHKTCSLSRNSGSGKGDQVLPAEGYGEDQGKTDTLALDTLAAQVIHLEPVLLDGGPPTLYNYSLNGEQASDGDLQDSPSLTTCMSSPVNSVAFEPDQQSKENGSRNVEMTEELEFSLSPQICPQVIGFPTDAMDSVRRELASQTPNQEKSDSVHINIPESKAEKQVSREFLETRFKIQQLSEPKQYMALLPHHIMVKIFMLLSTRSLVSLKCTCSYFKFIIEHYNIRPVASRWIQDPGYRDDPCKQCKKKHIRGAVSPCWWYPKPYCQASEYRPVYWMCRYRSQKDFPDCKLGLHDNQWVPVSHSFNQAIHKKAEEMEFEEEL